MALLVFRGTCGRRGQGRRNTGSIVWGRTLPIGEPERLLISYLSTPYANRANDDVDEGE